MKMKRIEVHGFKSFADKTDIELVDGLTAIVGPNGSGKSNIADAVKWVLGEQSPRVLRGNRMEDVIFGGTAKRKSIGFAEVTIVFDNSLRSLPLDFSEVSVTRRAYRSLESEYLINRRVCRLKDITELFLDTGIGRDSYSFVGQGRIEEIISADPRNRRIIFEEAAGISRYKLRKRETEARLLETAANLCRVQDVTAELRSQLEPLAEEAKRARTYLELSFKRRSWEQGLLVYEIVLLERQKQSLEQQKERLNDELMRLELGRNTYFAQQSANALLEIHVHARLKDSEKLLYEKKSSLRQMSERKVELIKALEKTQAQCTLVSKRLEQGRLEKDKLAEQLTQILQEEATTGARLAKLNEELRALTESVQPTIFGQEAALRKEIVASENTLFQMERELAALKKDLGAMAEQLSHKEVARARLLERHTLLLGQVDEQERSLAEEKQSLFSLNTEEQITQSTLSVIRQKQTKLSETNNRQQSLLFRAENRWKALKSSEEQMEGLSRGVKFILKAGLPGVVGVVGDLIAAPAGLETAIEVALGGAIADVITTSEEQAKEAIRLLRDKQQGRATFYPLDAVRPRAVREVPQDLKNRPEFLGRAVDLVKCDQLIRPVVEQLLGNVLIIDNINNATQVAKETGFAWRIVTLDGDVRQTSGSLTGGSRPEKQAWLLTRKREIKQAEQEAALLKEEQKTVESAMRAAQNRAAEATTAAERLRTAIEASKRIILTKELELAKVVAWCEQLSIDINGIDEFVIAESVEQAKTKRCIDLLENEVLKHTASLFSLRAEAARLSQETAQLEEAQVANEERSLALQVEIARQEALLVAFAARFAEQTTRQAEAVRRVQEAATELDAVRQDIDSLSADQARLEQSMVLIEQESTQVAQSFANEQTERVALENAQQQIAASLEKNNHEIHYIQQKLHNLEVRLERAKVEAEFLLVKQSELSQGEPCLAVVVNNRGEAEAALALLEVEIASLGAVRVSAIDEHERILERVAFLSQEQADLEKASDRLREVVANLDAVMGERFVAGFNQVKVAFQDMIARLFGGATSRLSLIDKDKPLESGIEIDVQPVGKRLQNISLLSGGERALVGIALVCAVLKVKPTPFCVLDEIDAPLDDANVERLIPVLRELGTMTQFLLITHTKGTMLAADVLYGVTMPEQGVSKILTVKVADVATS